MGDRLRSAWRGRQSVILRKGGIAEGRDGFAFRHREFFLFPTFFHEQVEKDPGDDSTELPEPTSLRSRCAFLPKWNMRS